VVVENIALVAIGKLVESARAAQSPAAIDHNDHETKFRHGLQPEARAETLGSEESLPARVDVLDDWILLTRIEIRWQPYEPVDRCHAVSRCALKWLRKFPSHVKQLVKIGLFEDSYLGTVGRAPQIGFAGKIRPGIAVDKKLTSRRKTPEQQGTTLIVTAQTPTPLAINLRIPYWAQGGSVRINGTTLPAFSSPSSYLTLNRTWKTGDKIELSLPMGLHLDPMPDDATIQAMMYGPLVLAGRFEAVGKDLQYGDYEPKNNPPIKVPGILADVNRPTAWVEPDAKESLTFHAAAPSQPVTMVPLYQIIRERYAVYWKVNTKST